MAIFIKEYVSVVTVLCLQDVAYHGVGGHALDEVFSGELIPPRILISILSLKISIHIILICLPDLVP